jgi:hypothetical protein
MLQRLWEWLNSFWEWFKELLQEFVLWVLSGLLDALVFVLNLIPVPAWAEDLALDWVPSSMAYFLEPFNIPLAVTAITTSYLIRFVIRRLPFVG